MTMNDRPIDNPRLQKALNECKAVFARYGLAGAVMLVSADEAAYCYAMHAPWSAIRYDPDTPLGWRIRSKEAEIGKAMAHVRMEGAVHTLCQLRDFGFQTESWMAEVLAMLRDAGIEFDHTPFGGKPLPPLMLGDPPR
jgi:hypothetical protein